MKDIQPILCSVNVFKYKTRPFYERLRKRVACKGKGTYYAMNTAKLSDSDKLDLSRKYFFIGLAFLPFVWLTNVVCFFRDAYCKPPSDARKKIRTYVTLSAIGCIVWLIIIAAWETFYQWFRSQGLLWTDQLAFTFPLDFVDYKKRSMTETISLVNLQTQIEQEDCNDSGYSGSSLASFSQFEGDIDFRLANDRAVLRDRVDLDHSRKTIVLERQSMQEDFGFRLKEIRSKTFEASTPDGHGLVQVVHAIFADSPAARAGLRMGDVIVGVNGREVLGYSTSEIFQLFTGLSLRLVLVYQDLKRIREQETKRTNLQLKLAMKERELLELEHEESVLLAGNADLCTQLAASFKMPIASYSLPSSGESQRSFWKLSTHSKPFHFDTFKFNRDCFKKFSARLDSGVKKAKNPSMEDDKEDEIEKLQMAFTHVIKLNPDEDTDETATKRLHSHADQIASKMEDLFNDSQKVENARLFCTSSFHMQSTRLTYLIRSHPTALCAIRCTSQGPLPNPPKEGSLSYKYERYISRWPKFLALHRMVVDGSRWCFSDVKTYIRVRRDISSKRRTLEQLSVEELEVLVQSGRDILKMSFLLTILQIPGPGDILILLLLAERSDIFVYSLLFESEGPKLGVVVTLLPLPFTVYVIGAAVIFFPRLILTRHFWTDAQRIEFFAKEVQASQDKAASLKGDLKTSSVEKLALPGITDLDTDKTTSLARLHGLIPLPLPGLTRRLISRSKALHRLDRVLSLNELTDRQLVFHCYIRRINFTGFSTEQMRAALQTWILLTSGLSESSYLAAPLLFNMAK
ncbi:unnamed protein product, partial [Mesorhabditis belari]|uniref:PDZ domain-containing protein n=1 Tax=Mesorhabditis belari TaxID=2138241 RepID=A0AAF3EFX4_9BILA